MQTKKQTIEMTLEEVNNLLKLSKAEKQRSRNYRNNGPTYDDFFSKYNASVNRLPELIDHLKENPFKVHEIKKRRHGITDGELYLAREYKGFVEVLSVRYIEEDHWKKDLGFSVNCKTRPDYSAGYGNYCLAGLVMGEEEKLHIPKLAKYNLRFEKPNEQQGNFKEYRYTKTVNEPFDYESILGMAFWKNTENSSRYIKEVINLELEEFSEYSPLNYFREMDLKGWKLGQFVLRPNCYKYDCFHLQPVDKDSVVRVEFTIPEDRNLEELMFNEVAKPEEVSNGVIVMNKDRIPKYLRRRWRIGERE